MNRVVCALVSVLAACLAGMGYLWVFDDEIDPRAAANIGKGIFAPMWRHGAECLVIFATTWPAVAFVYYSLFGNRIVFRLTVPGDNQGGIQEVGSYRPVEDRVPRHSAADLGAGPGPERSWQSSLACLKGDGRPPPAVPLPAHLSADAPCRTRQSGIGNSVLFRMIPWPQDGRACQSSHGRTRNADRGQIG